MSNEKEEGIVTLKVRGSKEPDYAKKLGNAICWQLRDHGICEMRAVKEEAVTAAVKAVAVANKKVKEAGVTLSFDAVFSSLESSEETSQSVLSFKIQEVEAESNDNVDYKVSARNHEDEKEVAKLAGAIAAMVRKDKTVILRCVGPAAIYKCVKAIVVAKGYVFANGILLESIPFWKTGTDVSVFAIEVRSRKA